MTKDGFLSELYMRIGRLPPEEIKRSRDFYSEAIDDRIEDGQAEEEAVAALGLILASAGIMVLPVSSGISRAPWGGLRLQRLGRSQRD